MKKIILIFFIIFSLNSVNSQIKKFGKVSVEELKSPKPTEFKDANAVILFKYRETHYEYDGSDGWKTITTIHERIQLYNKEAFDWATKKISFYTGDHTKERVSIKASTYNLENNKVVKTKLKSKDVFNKKENRFWSSEKFTMPNLKEGCIVEWKYTITSPHYHRINDVVFQYKIPILYMEALVKVPEYFIFNVDASKYYMINIKSQDVRREINYSYRETKSNTTVITQKVSNKVDLNEKNYIIKEKNIKPIKEEPLINNINNYIGKVRFELAGIKFPNSMYKNYTTNWNDVTKTINNLSDFGAELNKASYFKKDLENVLSGITDSNAKMNAVFEFVKSKVKWNGYYDYFTHDGVKKAYKEGSGNVAEINLMLVSMFREAGFDANPILVSTRSHGVPIFPTRKGFNYVIAGVELLNDLVLFDATEKYSTANILPKRDLNWKGRIIRKTGSSASIDLFPKVYSMERDILSVRLDENGNLEGSLRAVFSNLKALEYRSHFADLSEEKLISTLEESLSPIEIEKIRLGNKEDITKPFLISLKFSAEDQAEIINNKIYFNPIFMLNDLENTFKSDERKLPVDFASAWKESNEVSLIIPEGYKVEKLPDNLTINTEDGLGNFEYNISSKDNKIYLKVITKINLPIVPANMYMELKDFYNKKLVKLKEKVVLVKE